MPMTRLISTSLPLSGPNRQHRLRLAPIPRPSSKARSGAMENTQLTQAHTLKMPSENTMTSVQ